jgi:hypothetical protein
MRDAPPKKPAAKSARELHSLTSSFIKVRILHYAATETLALAALSARLRKGGRTVNAKNLHQLLVSMNRNGFLKTTLAPGRMPQSDPAYSVTPKGHRVLEVAKQQLKQLVAGRRP